MSWLNQLAALVDFATSSHRHADRKDMDRKCNLSSALSDKMINEFRSEEGARGRDALQGLRTCLVTIDRVMNNPSLSAEEKSRFKKQLLSLPEVEGWTWNEVVGLAQDGDLMKVDEGVSFDNMFEGIQVDELEALVNLFNSRLPKWESEGLMTNDRAQVQTIASGVTAGPGATGTEDLLNEEYFKDPGKLLDLYLNGDFHTLRRLADDPVMQMKIQQTIQNYTQTINLISSLQKTIHDCQMNLIRNI